MRTWIIGTLKSEVRSIVLVTRPLRASSYMEKVSKCISSTIIPASTDHHFSCCKPNATWSSGGGVRRGLSVTQTSGDSNQTPQLVTSEHAIGMRIYRPPTSYEWGRGFRDVWRINLRRRGATGSGRVLIVPGSRAGLAAGQIKGTLRR